MRRVLGTVTGPIVHRLGDVTLSESGDSENSRTRRILRCIRVPNEKNPDAKIQACIMHQKRHSQQEKWRDADSFNLAHLKSGQEVRISLRSGETLKLYEELKKHYRESNDLLDIVQASNASIDDEELKKVLRHLLDKDGEQLLQFVLDTEPDLLHTASIIQRHQQREEAVSEFQQAISEGVWSEAEWEAFFRTNTWIFGHNLGFQFLSTVANQPYYVKPSIFGQGGQRGDFMMATEADVRFTVLVDIKKPTSQLVNDRPYRNRVYQMSGELAAGVSQVQSNCNIWATNGSHDDREQRELSKRNIYTIEPKGMLIIGDTSSLDNDDKVNSFELFRRNLHNPQVLTYDELLERARFIVASEAEGLE